MYKVIVSANEHKKIQNLKIAQNKLTNYGFARIIPYLEGSATLNLSCNHLTEDILEEVICCKDGMTNLKIITMTSNKLVNERKAKNKVEELKKLGVMVTIWSFFINVHNFKSFPWIPFQFFLREHTMTILILFIISIARASVRPSFIVVTRPAIIKYLPAAKTIRTSWYPTQHYSISNLQNHLILIPWHRLHVLPQHIF